MTRVNLEASERRLNTRPARPTLEQAREAHEVERAILAARIATDRAQRDMEIAGRCFQKAMSEFGDYAGTMTPAKARRILPVHPAPSPQDAGERPLRCTWDGGTRGTRGSVAWLKVKWVEPEKRAQ